MEKQPFHIPSLDGFRTIAFLIVFLSHAGLDNYVPGGFGVTIFFFLSGYLITTLLRREHGKTGTISFDAFYKRRMIRIWPAFYFVLGLGTVATLAGLLPGDIRLMPMLGQILHLANYQQIFSNGGGTPAGTGVYWSLAVEEHFYLIFPLLYFLLLRLRCRVATQAIVLLSLCTAVLAWRIYLVRVLHVDDLNDHRTFYATDTRLDSILFGCVLAVFHNPVLDSPAGSDRLWKFVLLPAGVAGLAFALFYRNPAFRETFRYTLQGLALGPVFVAAIRWPKWCPFSILNWKWVRAMGVLTYPLYLVHFTVLVAVREALPHAHPILQGLAAFGVSLLWALAIHRFVELPASRFFRRSKPPSTGAA